MSRIGNVHALLDAMLEQAATETAVSGHDWTGDLGAAVVNLARDGGLSEDKIIDALSRREEVSS